MVVIVAAAASAIAGSVTVASERVVVKVAIERRWRRLGRLVLRVPTAAR